LDRASSTFAFPRLPDQLHALIGFLLFNLVNVIKGITGLFAARIKPAVYRK
jgi:hypothetical protein